jgi:hypothetical protein
MTTNDELFTVDVLLAKPKQEHTIIRPKSTFKSVFTNNEEIVSNLFGYNPILEKLAFTGDFVIAGGSIVAAMTGHTIRESEIKNSVGDIDIFMHGHTDIQSCSKRVRELCREICNIAHELFGSLAAISFKKTVNTINIKISDPIDPIPFIAPIQIICRNYSDIASILNTFDVQCCECAYNGKTIIMTRRAANAFRTKLNTIDVSRVKYTYEHRLTKYFNRGFGIDFPCLKYKYVAPAKGHEPSIELTRLNIWIYSRVDEHNFVGTVETAWGGVQTKDTIDYVDLTGFGVVLSVNKHMTIFDYPEIELPMLSWEKGLIAVENGTLLKPLTAFTNRLLGTSASTFIVQEAGLIKGSRKCRKYTKELKTQALLNGQTLEEYLAPKLEVCRATMIESYNNCLSRMTMFDNMVWEITPSIYTKQMTDFAWYGEKHYGGNDVPAQLVELIEHPTIIDNPVAVEHPTIIDV